MGKLGTAIRERRKELHIKVYELAKKAGVHPTYITYIEKHNRLPSLEIISKLEGILKISLQELYFKEKHPSVEFTKAGLCFQTSNNNISSFTVNDEMFVQTPEAREALKISIVNSIARQNPDITKTPESREILKKAVSETIEVFSKNYLRRWGSKTPTK